MEFTGVFWRSVGVIEVGDFLRVEGVGSGLAGEGEVLPSGVAGVLDFDLAFELVTGFHGGRWIVGFEDFVAINWRCDGNGDGDVVSCVGLTIEAWSDLEVDGFTDLAGAKGEIESAAFAGFDAGFI